MTLEIPCMAGLEDVWGWSGGRSQRSEVRGQGAEVRGQVAGVRGQGADGKVSHVNT
ncbi:hypothetical protein [Desulfonatronovibrio magnus]|uniref:hypothetical protein n=1 Tax=Desulfonatronovibrio magnus TaxID=698827 RepID=UPI0012FB23CE|nr:hypothetical protein [Desulfonatronovibrio magnus]